MPSGEEARLVPGGVPEGRRDRLEESRLISGVESAAVSSPSGMVSRNGDTEAAWRGGVKAEAPRRRMVSIASTDSAAASPPSGMVSRDGGTEAAWRGGGKGEAPRRRMVSIASAAD
ncbi:hypothetical protein ACUY1T_21550, partial [Billgrantia sp. Q4P2]|uniref:hypothetical protein n=1 Tax=Billgrantia sp. Q4P2 TaxID=3463857 RepID=UPI004056C67B